MFAHSLYLNVLFCFSVLRAVFFFFVFCRRQEIPPLFFLLKLIPFFFLACSSADSSFAHRRSSLRHQAGKDGLFFSVFCRGGWFCFQNWVFGLFFRLEFSAQNALFSIFLPLKNDILKKVFNRWYFFVFFCLSGFCRPLPAPFLPAPQLLCPLVFKRWKRRDFGGWVGVVLRGIFSFFFRFF